METVVVSEVQKGAKKKKTNSEGEDRKLLLSFMHSHVCDAASVRGLKVHTNLSASELLANGLFGLTDLTSSGRHYYQAYANIGVE